MRSLALYCAVLALFCLIGCDGGGPAPSSAPTPQPSEAAKAEMMKQYSGKQQPDAEKTKINQ